MLSIYAGKQALKTIQQQGFKQELFSHFLGASGGPKWFVLFGLDKYLFGDFFKERTTPLELIGSSAGAFRSACLAQKDPVSAISRLADEYSHTVYSKNANAKEITQKARELLDQVLPEQAIFEVINNLIFHANFIVAKTKGLTQFEQKLPQLMGLISSMARNKISRNWLKGQYQRFVFQAKNAQFSLDDPYQFNTDYLSLTPANFKDALLASGSIPLVMQGIKDITGAPKGMYRDGGIIDYHFDFNINNTKLILYPHFNHAPKAGWFDKSSNRRPIAKSYDNVVLLAPSQQFIDSLPHKKIPDRTDFTQMPATERINYWQKVLTRSTMLAECLHEVIAKPEQSLKPLPW